MHIHFRISARSLSRLSTALLVATSAVTAFAQGSLSPAAAPAPTMKTLDQIQPRTPINSLPYTINTSGSYYFTTNVIASGPNGLIIQANDVELDLNGFALIGAPGTGAGIFVNGSRTNVTVRDGSIRNWGSLGFTQSTMRGARLLRLRVWSNGGAGIDAGADAVVEDCVVEDNSIGSDAINAGSGSRILRCTARRGFRGIVVADGYVTDSLALSNSSIGILGTGGTRIQNCTALGNGSSGVQAGSNAHVVDSSSVGNNIGFSIGDNALISRCSAFGSANRGIVAGNGAVVSDCSASTNAAEGIKVSDGCRIQNCVTRMNGGSGIAALSACHISDCTVTGNGNFAIDVNTGSCISDCVVALNNGIAINTQNRCQVTDCNISGNVADGIRITADCVVRNVHSCDNGVGMNSVDGIYVTGDRNHIEGNILRENGGYGIRLSTSSNVIIRNNAKGNGTGSYFLGAGVNDVGPVGTAATSTSPFANIQ